MWISAGKENRIGKIKGKSYKDGRDNKIHSNGSGLSALVPSGPAPVSLVLLLIFIVMFYRPLIKLSPPLCSKVHVCQQFPAFCLFVLNMLHPFLVHLSSYVPFIFITSTSISVSIFFLMSHITHFNVFRYTALKVMQCFLNLGSAWIVFVYVIVISTDRAVTTSC